MGTPKESLLICRQLEVGYQGRPLLPPLSLQLDRGAFYVVLGRNGSGKTTFLRTLVGLQPPLSGSLVSARRGISVAYVSQKNGFDDSFPMLARDVVRQGAERSWSFLRWHWREPPSVAEALAAARASELADRPFASLSEGQKQRVLLARLAVSQPDIAFLDEPTAAMDVVAEQETFASLDSFRRKTNATLVVVSHSLELARLFAEQVIFLDADARIAQVASFEKTVAHPTFRQVYGENAFEVMPHA